MSMHWTQIHLWQQEGWAEKHREVETSSPSSPAQAMAFLASYHPLEQEWRPVLWPISLSPSPDTLWRERGVKPPGRKGLLVWGNWPDPGRGQGAGFHRPSFLCSLLSSSFCFSPSPFLSFELSLVSISRKFWPQKMSWEMCPLFSGKKEIM